MVLRGGPQSHQGDSILDSELERRKSEINQSLLNSNKYGGLSQSGKAILPGIEETQHMLKEEATFAET